MPVLAAATPFGVTGGTRITVRIDHLDGTIGQGIGRFKLSVTDAANPLEGADLAARVRPTLALPMAERTAAQADELAAIFRSTSPLLKPAREALAAARKALGDLQIPGDHGQQIVNIVCHTAGEAAHGFHRLGLPQLVLELHAIADVVDHPGVPQSGC